MVTKLRAEFLNINTPPSYIYLIVLSGLGALSLSIFLSSILEMSVFLIKSYALMQLSISLYLITTAFFQIIAGPLSDKFWQKNNNFIFNNDFYYSLAWLFFFNKV